MSWAIAMTASNFDSDSPSVACAWCGQVLSVRGEAVSHGICRECLPRVIANVEDLLPAIEEASREEPLEPT